MIDCVALKARLLQSREFTVAIDGRTFTLRLPPQFQLLVAERRVRAHHPGDPVAPLYLQRALTEEAIVGWDGVVVGDVFPGDSQAAEPLQFDPLMVPLLLDEQTGWSLRLGGELVDRLHARNAASAEDAKN